jgi:hypothetical protein
MVVAGDSGANATVRAALDEAAEQAGFLHGHRGDGRLDRQRAAATRVDGQTRLRAATAFVGACV